MADDDIKFEIDDDKTVDENLAALNALLNEIDPDLAAILSPEISKFSQSEDVAKAELLNALYAATAAKEEADT